jgi:plastocyanin
LRKPALLAAALIAISLPLAACGDDEETASVADTTSTNQSGPPVDNPDGGPAPTTVDLAADPDGALAYDMDELTVAAGQPTIAFTNDSGIDHDVVVEDANGNVIGQSEIISSGSSEASFDAESDVYTFYCSVDAHREAGMEGTLTVVND